MPAIVLDAEDQVNRAIGHPEGNEIFASWMLPAMGEVLLAISGLPLTLRKMPFILSSSGGQRSP